MRLTPIVTLVLFGAASPAGEPRSTVQVTAPVPAESDGCLDHTVKELGMSAKRVEKERRWNIGPQYLHPSVAKDGAFTVEHVKTGEHTTVTVVVSWPGALKAPAVQAELEERLRAMVTKMTQLCGVLKPALTCTVSSAGAAAAPCAAR